MIFLAIVPPNSEEIHVKWKEYTKIEDATTELNNIRSILMKQDKMPYDCYVYDAEKPPFGLPAYEVDDVDMNFYEDKPKPMRTIRDLKNDLKKAVEEVAVLAKEEQEKYGKIDA